MDFAPWPYFEADEIQAVVKVLKSGKVNQWTGNEIIDFEKEFARYMGVKHAIALANGSLALDLALTAFDIGNKDEVIVTPRSFIASVSCVVLREAVPVFVDVDPVSQNMTLETISHAVTSRTKAVIAVNLAGWPCELDKIQKFCRQKNLVLIEDCAQSHGAAYKGQKAGSFGDCAVFSFCQDKIMTTGGEGGMLVTNNTELWERVWSYKDHGKNFDRVFSQNHASGFRWLAGSFGTNCRMTEMQAAMGRIMLKKLDTWVEKRRQFAGLFNQAFHDMPGLRTTIPDESIYHSYYKYSVFIDPGALKKTWDRDRVLEALNQKKIPCNAGICPEIYLEEAFKTCEYRLQGPGKDQTLSRLPIAKQLGETSMVFWVHPTLEMKSILYVIDQVKIIMEKAVR
ncbi:MAG: DegT/DnrJ/EryC1/StrS aminotransferase family protein [Proteobacteria bacterium]|nr:DegT/DnrJ/EryC1/StrS aminotransferase family protein [Desulfobacula sp.]MBU3952954.1 DegT/DnrJ/EryC1/StrS aminotransferase family protein [Pseudomonadota bacterium]MBU4129820.1 DegT/DnrJ/EryC1/StrS aminotransferase family protein [Pseudomonadota bacterium]